MKLCEYLKQFEGLDPNTEVWIELNDGRLSRSFTNSFRYDFVPTTLMNVVDSSYFETKANKYKALVVG